MVDVDYIKNIAAEFEDTAPSRIEFWIEQAQLSVDATVWGDRYDLGVGFLTCHYLTMASRRGKGGVVKSEKVGDLSKEYDNGNLDNFDDLDATAYGQQFKRLRRSIIVTPRVVGCG